LITALGAGAFCPQTAIADIEYLIFIALWPKERHCLSPHKIIALPLANLVHVLILLDFVIMQKFFKDMLD
jgi:hypothetical protein